MAAVALAAAGCGESATYSPEEVVHAFGRHGYALVAPEVPGRTVTADDGHLLTPRSREDFIVLVLSDASAGSAWAEYESQQTRE